MRRQVCFSKEEQDSSHENINQIVIELKNILSAMNDEKRKSIDHLFKQMTLKLNQILNHNSVLYYELQETQNENSNLKLQLEELNKKYESIKMRMTDAFNQFARTTQNI